MIQYVFGEFQEPLLELRGKLYENGDVENAKRVTKILDGMFNL